MTIKTCRRCSIPFEVTGKGNFTYCFSCRERTCADCKQPWKPLRPSTDETRCGDCRYRAAMEAQKPSSDFEYSSRAKWSRRVLSDSNGCCSVCGGKDDLHAHHIIPRSLGGRNTAENGTVLCVACHAEQHTPLATAALLDDLAERIAPRVAQLLSEAA